MEYFRLIWHLSQIEEVGAEVKDVLAAALKCFSGQDAVVVAAAVFKATVVA